MSLHIAISAVSQGQNWCCVFKKVQYRLSFCILLHPICHKDKTGLSIRKGAISPMSLHMCIQKGAISPKSLHIAISDISQGQNWCCVFKTVQYCPMSLHIAASDISQGQNWCCLFKKVKYRLKSLHIAASDISHGHTVVVLHS